MDDDGGILEPTTNKRKAEEESNSLEQRGKRQRQTSLEVERANPQITSPAAAAVFATTELTEAILELVERTTDLVNCKRVCHSWRNVINSTGSRLIKQKLFLKQCPGVLSGSTHADWCWKLLYRQGFQLLVDSTKDWPQSIWYYTLFNGPTTSGAIAAPSSTVPTSTKVAALKGFVVLNPALPIADLVTGYGIHPIVGVYAKFFLELLGTDHSLARTFISQPAHSELLIDMSMPGTKGYDRITLSTERPSRRGFEAPVTRRGATLGDLAEAFAEMLHQQGGILASHTLIYIDFNHGVAA